MNNLYGDLPSLKVEIDKVYILVTTIISILLN